MISYTIKRKKIKNIILKITHSGAIEISAPPTISEETIRNFVKSKEIWIDKKLKVATLKDKRHSPIKDGYIYLLGEKKSFPIDLYENISHDILKESLGDYFKRESESFITPIIEKYLEITDLKMEHLTYRKMKTRWGSCNTRKRYININSILVASPLESIEYIVLHEIAHLKFPHHQKDFWNFVAQHMPDWRERRKKLLYFEI